MSRGFAEVDIQVNPTYSFTLLGVHLKSKLAVSEGIKRISGNKRHWFCAKRSKNILTRRPTANLVILGDFNDTKESKPMRALLGRQKNGLVDVRPAERNGDDQPNPHPRYALPRVTWTYYYAVDDTYSRIDYILQQMM